MFSAFRIVVRLVLGAALLCASCGCATLKKVHLLPHRKPKKTAAAEAPAPRLIGTVALVNRDDRFVLIDTGTAPVPTAGTALKTFTAGAESGVVSVGDVRRRPFVVADIVKGSPERGDRVYQ
jgi:hypothetical protein